MLLHHIRVTLFTAIFCALYVAMHVIMPLALDPVSLLFKMEVVFIYAYILSGILAGALQPFLYWGLAWHHTYMARAPQPA